MPKFVAEVAGTEAPGISQLRKNVIYCGHAIFLPQESLVQRFQVDADPDSSIGFGNDEECRNPWARFADGLDKAEVLQPSKLSPDLVVNAQRKSAESVVECRILHLTKTSH